MRGLMLALPRGEGLGLSRETLLLGAWALKTLMLVPLLENSGDDVGHHGGVIVGGDGDICSCQWP